MRHRAATSGTDVQFPVKAGLAGNAQCHGNGVLWGTAPLLPGHQPRVLAVQSWHRAEGRARAGSSCSPGLGELRAAASTGIHSLETLGRCWEGSSAHSHGIP